MYAGAFILTVSKMKKIICFALCLLVFVSCFGICANAESYGTIIGESAEVERGETFTVKFNYQNNPGFWIIFMTLYFDSDSLELVESKKGDYKGVSFNLMTYADNPGKILLDIEGNSAKDVTGDGVLAEVTFKVKENAKIQKNAIVISVGDGKACNFETELIRPAVNYSVVNIVCKEHEMENGTCKICGFSDGTNNQPEVVVPAPENEKDKTEIGETVVNTQNAGQEVLPEKPKEPTQQENQQTNNENNNPKNINVYALVGALAVILIAVVLIIIYIIKKK